LQKKRANSQEPFMDHARTHPILIAVDERVRIVNGSSLERA
jgi:hypothetical protein